MLATSPGNTPSSVHMKEGPLGHDGSAIDVQTLPTQYWLGDEQEMFVMGVGLLAAHTFMKFFLIIFSKGNE